MSLDNNCLGTTSGCAVRHTELLLRLRAVNN